MSQSQITVQSLAPAAGYPVAVTYRDTTGTGSLFAVQHMVLTDGASNVPVTVFSFATSQPMAVRLVDATGAGFDVWSVAGTVVGSVSVAGSVHATVVGSMRAAQTGSWQIDVGNVLSAHATVIGSIRAAQTGSWQVDVGNIVSAHATTVGSVRATQAGSWNVQVDCVTVFQGPTAWGVVGSVRAIQQGSWLVDGNVTGSVQATQSGSWTVSIGNVTSVHASVLGSVRAVQQGSWVVDLGAGSVTVGGSVHATAVGSVRATQAGSWQVDVGNVVSAHATVVGSVRVTQSGSWNVLLYGFDLGTDAAPIGVSSFASGNLLRVDVVRTSGSGGGDGAVTDGADGTIKATVRSYASGRHPLLAQLVSSGGALAEVTSLAGGGALKVDLVQGTISGADGALLDGVDGGIKATVRSTAGDHPLAVVLVDSVGGLHYPLDVVGSLRAIQSGSWTVDIGNVHSVHATAVGSVRAIQQGSWTVEVISGFATVIGSVRAVQSGSWTVEVGCAHATVVGSIRALQTGSWTVDVGNVVSAHATVVGSIRAMQSGSWTVEVGCAHATVVGSIRALQSGSWQVDAVGSVRVLGTFPNSTYVSSNAAPVLVGGVAWHPDSGVPPGVGSGGAVLGLFDLHGRARTRVDTGDIAVTGSVNAVAVGSVQASQVGSWIVSIGAVHSAHATVVGSTRAIQSGSWQVDVVSGFATVAGSVQATQQGSWIVSIGNVTSVTGAVVGSVRAVQQGSWTVDVISGFATVAGSVRAIQSGSWQVDVVSAFATVVGSTRAIQSGSWTVDVGCGHATVVGSVRTVQQGSWQVDVVGSVRAIQQGSWNVNVVGSVQASQAGTWVFTGDIRQLGSWITGIGSQAADPGVVTVAGSVTAPTSIDGGALNVRAISPHRGAVQLLNAQVFSRGTSLFTFTASMQVDGLKGYESFILYVTLTKANTPTDIRIRPMWSDGVTATSWYDMNQGMWTDLRVSDDVILAGSLYMRTFVGPVLGPSMLLLLTGDTNGGSGSITATVHAEFIGTPRWMAT